MGRSVFVRLLAGMAVLALALAACGDADVAESTTSSAESPSTTSADAATTSEATVTTETGSGQIVQVFFASADQSDCSNTEVFDRTIDEAADPIQSAFMLLVAGPTEEEQAEGAGSFFSSDTEGMVRSTVLENGLLTVDFQDLRPVIPNASTSCGSFSLIAQLNDTAFQFEEVDRVTYQIEGSCETFFNWLQRDCQQYPRP